MATFDHPSDLVHGIPYPAFQWPRPVPDSRVAPFRAKEEKQPLVPSSQQGIEGSLFFEIEAGARLRRNPWAAVGSLVLPLLGMLTVLLIPLLHTDPLPNRTLLTMLYLQPPAAAGSTATKIQAPASTFTSQSVSIPNPLHETQEVPPPTPAPTPVGTIGGVVGGVPGGVVGGIPVGVLSEVMSSTRSVPVPAKTPDPMPVKRMRVPARIAEANLIHDVPPKYPAEAGQGRIEGTVVLVAVIGKDGCVQDVRVESGLPILAEAAIDAVRQWRYKPYMLNGEPVEVDSRITINFTLSKS